MIDRGLLAAATHGLARSPHWSTVEHAFRSTNPTCTACGSSEALQVHHVEPFHFCVLVGRPDLELDPRNLISLCERAGEDHHLLLGHDGDFRSSNPNVRADVVTFQGMTADAVRGNAAWLAEKTTRYRPWAVWTSPDRLAYRAKLDSALPPDPALLARYGLTIGPYAG